MAPFVAHLHLFLAGVGVLLAVGLDGAYGQDLTRCSPAACTKILAGNSTSTDECACLCQMTTSCKSSQNDCAVFNSGCNYFACGTSNDMSNPNPSNQVSLVLDHYAAMSVL